MNDMVHDPALLPFELNPLLMSPLVRALTVGPVAAALVDPRERIVWSNPLFDEYLLAPDVGPTPVLSDLIRANIARGHGRLIMDELADLDGYLEKLRARLKLGAPLSFSVDQRSGIWLWMTHIPVQDGWDLILASDITPLKTSELALRVAHDQTLHASRTDPLTDLPNRRYAMELAEQYLAAPGQSFALAVLDIDHFKGVNDQFGHQVGDEFLRQFCHTVAQRVRANDRLCRLAGDEFVLLLPGAGANDLTLLQDRLQEACPPALCASVAEPIPMRFSGGMAASRPGEGIDSLMRRADRALYAAKRAGRGQVVIAGVDGNGD